MNLARLTMRGFMSHADTSIDFPARGLVVVTGTNGAGKSSIVEGVSVAFHGKTLRGSDPWAGDGVVIATTSEGLTAQRENKKGKKSLTWHRKDETPTVYETTTKAQDALERVVGSWDVWRRASVFSSSDASHFTLATDAERKRLLESILGLERFDVAADKARADAAIASATATRLDREAAIAKERAEAAQAALEAAENALNVHDAEQHGDPAALAKQADDLEAAIATAEAESKKLAKAVEAATKDLRDAEAVVRKAEQAAIAAASTKALADDRARRARADLAKLTGAKSPDCPTCGKPLEADKRERLTAAADKAEREALAAAKEADTAKARADEEKTAASGNVEELREERDALQERLAPHAAKVAKLRGDLARVESELRTAKGAKARRDHLLIDFNNAVAKSAEAKSRAKTAAEEAKAADKKRRTFEACTRVLGTKGVRAHVLGSALGGMEVIANAWLARLGTGVACTISAYTEKKTGGQSDAISLNLLGTAGSFGNGQGYKAASAGERRRVDIALLLALGEVSAAAHGKDPGTLFVDEVFDALDTDGVAACAGALRELAGTRCVVVITHNPELVSALKADRHLIVREGGKVERAA